MDNIMLLLKIFLGLPTYFQINPFIHMWNFMKTESVFNGWEAQSNDKIIHIFKIMLIL